jgi:hypothetical protein
MKTLDTRIAETETLIEMTKIKIGEQLMRGSYMQKEIGQDFDDAQYVTRIEFSRAPFATPTRGYSDGNTYARNGVRVVFCNEGSYVKVIERIGFDSARETLFTGGISQTIIAAVVAEYMDGK